MSGFSFGTRRLLRPRRLPAAEGQPIGNIGCVFTRPQHGFGVVRPFMRPESAKIKPANATVNESTGARTGHAS
jgi:hypothetical protein